jgi:aminoglycoside phosphotransferase family enzyme/predicted kinase
MADDQSAVIAFLGDPASHGPGVTKVDIVETHISIVFLAGEFAYKLKRAVKLPYLDFSTASLRHAACAAELTLNRRTAPELYLELRPIGRDAQGNIGFLPEGEALDWVVVMRRFDQAQLFDALAVAGRLEPPLMTALADHIASFHAMAERRYDRASAAALQEVAETNHACLAAAGQAGFEPQSVASIRAKWSECLTRLAPGLEARRAAGKIRRVHGDLHLRNICFYGGKPLLFDCLEFSDALASIDILYDLAFLLMDLEFRGLGALANLVLNRYLDVTGEDDGLAALPLFMSLRAGIRAHVTASAIDPAAAQAEAKAGEARAYLDLAHRLLDPAPARLVAIGGLSGSGKSTLAAALAPELGRAPGARLLRSDVARKLLFGIAPECPLPESAYTSAVSRRVYGAIEAKAAVALAAGYAAIIDAVALRHAERRAFAAIAAKAGVSFTGIWLVAPAAAMADRISTRRHDASDASPAVLARQMRQDPGALDWTRIDASAGPGQVLAAARRALA